MHTDYYKVLGVDKTGGEKEIREAYRRLAKQYHPDRNREQGAEHKFKLVTEAYEVLSDPGRRRSYDESLRAAVTGPGYGIPVPEILEDLYRTAYDIRHRRTKPWLRYRRQLDKKLFRHALVFFVLPLILFVGLMAGYYFYLERAREDELEKYGTITSGTVVSVTPGVRSPAYARFIFMANGKPSGAAAQLWLTSGDLPVSENGLPVRAGDIFPVLYSGRDPSNCRLLTSQITSGQAGRYLEMAKEKCIAGERGRIATETADNFCACLAEGIYRKYGQEGLALLIFRDAAFFSNMRHNRNKFREFERSDEYRTIQAACNDHRGE